MNENRIKIAIHGSCCSREIFNSSLNTFDLRAHLFQNPIHTMFENPFPAEIKEEDVLNNSNFMRRMIASEFNKKALQTLANNPADYLMIDVGDLRLGRFNLSFNNGKRTKIYNTKDTQKELRFLKDELKTFDFSFESCSEIADSEWDYLIDKYTTEIKKIYPLDKIIFNQIAIASQYEKEGKLIDFTVEVEDDTFKNQGLLLKLQNKLKEKLKGCLILDNPPFPIIADSNHKFGLHLLHLKQEVYDYKMRKLQEIIMEKEKYTKQENKTITVKNAEGDSDTQAEIIIQNKIDYTPKVSVIIPVYNVEEYLRECLDSVVNQTLKEIEIICVDDGSTDNSLEILKEYTAKDKRITIMKQKNLYAGVARNAGLSQAKGEYLSFLDSDDFFELNMLEEVYEKVKKTKTDIVMFNAYLYDDTLKQDKEVDWTLDVKNVPEIFNYKDVSDKVFKLSNCWVWNRLYNHNFIKKNNLAFQSLGCANDTFFSCIATVQAHKITYTEKRYVHYRTNRQKFQNVTSPEFRHKHPTALLNCFYSIYLKLKQLNIYTELKKAYLHVTTEHIAWSSQAFKNNNELYLQFSIYFAQNYKDIFSDHSPFSNNVLSKKYIILRNILIDNGIINEIPKRIFYVWGANEPKREEVKKCISSWKKYLPDYDIVEINDESTEYFNFQEELKNNKWFRTVYNRKMWAYVADYIRIKTLYNHGGIYFDTDVSVVQNIDKFLHEPAFVGMQRSSLDGNGDWVEPAVLGAKKSNLFIKKILHFYENLIWEKPIYTMPQLFDYFLREYDIFPFPDRNSQKIIKLDNITIYPEKYFIPYRFREEYSDSCITPDTHTIHWWGSSWVKPYIQHFLQNKHKTKESNEIIISLIIAVFNDEKYLKECLDSAINQTLKNIEIICINDGSTDNSLNILKEYEVKDKRIIIIDQKNQGLASSRNNALKIAKGKYVVFLDSDDYLVDDALEKIYCTMEYLKIDMLSYSGVNFDDKTKVESINDYWEFLYLPNNFDYTKFNFKKCSSFAHRMAVSSCLTAYKLGFIKQNDILFPPHLFYEDNVFFTKALIKANNCGIIKDKLYYRRIHQNSITQNWEKHFSDFLKIIDLVLTYLKENHIENYVIKNYTDSYQRAVN